MKKPHARSYPDAHNAKLRKLLEELVKEYRSQSSLARAANVNQSTISQVLDGKAMGKAFASAICALRGTTPDEFLGLVGQKADPTDPYPNRAHAIPHLRALGIPNGIILELRAFQPGKDLPILWWAERAFRRARDLRDDEYFLNRRR